MQRLRTILPSFLIDRSEVSFALGKRPDRLSLHLADVLLCLAFIMVTFSSFNLGPSAGSPVSDGVLKHRPVGFQISLVVQLLPR